MTLKSSKAKKEKKTNKRNIDIWVTSCVAFA